MNSPAISLGINVLLKNEFADALKRVTLALQAAGFEIISNIDVQHILDQKLSVSFRPYRIVGVVVPDLLHKALTITPYVGLMLPHNVIVRQHDDDVVEVSLIDPVVATELFAKPYLRPVAEEVHARLEHVANALKN